MIRVALQTCLTVMALLISASVSVAAECADDPNECTLKKLCEAATTIDGGNTIWSTEASSAKHVSTAQTLGMECGITAIVDLCDTDPSECKLSQICGKATTESAGQVSWDDSAAAYVAVAQEYDLSCGVKVQTTSIKKICSAYTPEVCNDKWLCIGATQLNYWTKIKSWNLSSAGKGYLKEAKKRGLSCSVLADNELSKKLPLKSIKKVEEAPKKTCTDNANLCDSVNLCAFASYWQQDSSKSNYGQWVWRKGSSYRAYVKEAKKRGLSCRVKAKTGSAKKDKCSFDQPDKCTKQQLCEKSTYKYKKQLIPIKNVYFKEAKKRGLSCGVVERNASGELPTCPSGVFHNCFGTATFANGDKYVGEFKDNKRNGQGTYTLSNGEKYVGEWKDGKNNGQGIYTFPRGDKYVGEWKNDKKHGQGTYTFPSGRTDEGVWKNDELVLQTANLFEKSDFNALNSTKRKQLQYGLKKLGYYTSSIDGAYGPNTQRAVRGYAAAKGISSGYPNSIYNRIISDVNVPASFATAQQSTSSSSSSSSSSSGGSSILGNIFKGLAVAGVCSRTPSAAACLDGAMDNSSNYGSSSSSGNSSVSSNSCNSNYDCAYSSVCIKRAGQGQCMKLPRGSSRSNFEATECSNNSDCGSKSKCNRTYKICVKKY